jgi:hypothetical protein
MCVPSLFNERLALVREIKSAKAGYQVSSDDRLGANRTQEVPTYPLGKSHKYVIERHIRFV